MTAWAFAVAFLAAGFLVETLGARSLILVAGAGGVVVWAATRLALRGTWRMSSTPPVEGSRVSS